MVLTYPVKHHRYLASSFETAREAPELLHQNCATCRYMDRATYVFFDCEHSVPRLILLGACNHGFKSVLFVSRAVRYLELPLY